METVIKYCACGCGNEIIPVPHHKYHPATHLWGHGRTAKTRAFLEANKNKHVCKCGCGEFIEILSQHKSQGIPNFKPRHHITNILQPALKQSNALHRVKVNRTKKFEFTFWQRVAILRKFNFACAKCSWNTDYTKLEFDHIQPVSMNGETTIDNGQVLCGNCHADKTNEETSNYRYNVWRDAATIIQEKN